MEDGGRNMNEREYRKLNRVHNIIKEPEARCREALDSDDESLQDVFRELQEPDAIIAELLEGNQ